MQSKATCTTLCLSCLWLLPLLQGFISPQHKNLVVSDDPEALIEQLQQWQPPASNVLADAVSRAAAVGEDISQASDA